MSHHELARGRPEDRSEDTAKFVPRPMWWIGLVLLVILLLALPLKIHPVDNWIHSLFNHDAWNHDMQGDLLTARAASMTPAARPAIPGARTNHRSPSREGDQAGGASTR